MCIYSRNYAPTVCIQNKAAEKGCDQVLWLLGEERQVRMCTAANLQLAILLHIIDY